VVTLRKAERRDIPRICALFLEMLRSVYQTDEAAGYQEGDLDSFFEKNENWICVAETEGAVVGYLSMEVHREQEGFLYLDDFCVKESFRNRGLGSELLTEAEHYAAQKELNSLVLHVECVNRNARRFYAHRGFQILREEGSRLRLIKYLQPEPPAARVARMEHYLDTIQSAVRGGAEWCAEDAPANQMLRSLIEYYENGLWMEDFARDERGEFPD